MFGGLATVGMAGPAMGAGAADMTVVGATSKAPLGSIHSCEVVGMPGVMNGDPTLRGLGTAEDGNLKLSS